MSEVTPTTPLLPCPFCGGKAWANETWASCANERSAPICPAATGEFTIAQWNRRAAPPASPAATVAPAQQDRMACIPSCNDGAGKYCKCHCHEPDAPATVAPAQNEAVRQSALPVRTAQSTAAASPAPAPSLPLAEIDRLEALEKKATPGPWTWKDWHKCGADPDYGKVKLVLEAPPHTRPDGAKTFPNLGNPVLCLEEPCQAENAALIPALRNAFPSLAATIRAQAERIEALTEAVEEAKAQAERDCSEAMEERDAFEAQIGRMVASAGLDCEWSSCHDHEDCIEEAFAAQAERVRVLTEAVEVAKSAMREFANVDYNGSEPGETMTNALARIQSLVGGAGEKETK